MHTPCAGPSTSSSHLMFGPMRRGAVALAAAVAVLATASGPAAAADADIVRSAAMSRPMVLTPGTGPAATGSADTYGLLAAEVAPPAEPGPVPVPPIDPVLPPADPEPAAAPWPASIPTFDFRSTRIPTVLTTAAEIRRAKKRVRAKAQPYHQSWTRMVGEADRARTRKWLPRQDANHADYWKHASTQARRIRANALVWRIGGNPRHRDTAIQGLTAWARDAVAHPHRYGGSAQPTSAGLVLGRSAFMFADAYALLYPSMTEKQKDVVRTWMYEMAGHIKDSARLWSTTTGFHDYNGRYLDYRTPYFGNQLYSNHLAAQTAGVMALGFALRDWSLVHWSMSADANAKTFPALLEGMILMPGDALYESDPTLTRGAPTAVAGELWDRHRVTGGQGLHYTALDLRLLTLMADLLANNGAGRYGWTLNGRGGESLKVSFRAYAGAAMSGGRRVAGGYYRGNLADPDLRVLYELAHRAYPKDPRIAKVLSGSRVKYDAQTFGWSLLLVDGV